VLNNPVYVLYYAKTFTCPSITLKPRKGIS
jgi:hypothetical protein